MSYCKYLKCFRIFLLVILAVSLSSCIGSYPTGSSKILKLYVNPRISTYKIEKIGLLPLEYDDTTNFGTFYSTNYFLKTLKNKFKKINFEMIEIDQITESDTFLISNLIDSIENKKHLDLRKFYSVEFDSILSEKNPDAIIIGKINNNDNNFRLSYDVQPWGLYYIYSTTCNFTYYLISLKDGRVLWRADVLGADFYIHYYESAMFPPLDAAISNGIDKIISKLSL